MNVNAHRLALVAQLNGLATRWRNPSLLDIEPVNGEMGLASACWDVVSTGIEFGYFGGVLNPLLEYLDQAKRDLETTRKKSTGISFRPPGWQFHILVGYNEVYEREYEEPDGSESIHRVFRAGVINYIADDAFPDIIEWDFVGLETFERSNRTVRTAIYEQYAVVCELLAVLMTNSQGGKDSSVKSKPIPSECEQFIFREWSRMKESGGKATLASILQAVMERYPNEEQRKRKTGRDIGLVIINTDDINSVVNCLKLRANRKNQKPHQT